MRKKNLLLSIYILITALCIFGILNTESTKPEYWIKFATQGSKQDEDYLGLLAFKQHVEHASNGRVQVSIYPSGQFCANVPECIGNLQNGVLEGFLTTVGGAGNFFAPVQVLDLPYVFDDDEQAECVLSSDLMTQMRDEILSQGLNIRLLSISNTGGWRNFATTTKAIHHPDDLVGQKIRTTPASIQQQLVRELGGNPTPISWSELYTALATGVVEGSKNGIQDIISAKLQEHIKFMVLDGHSYMSGFWWFSEPVWQSLPEDIQQLIIEGFAKQKAVAKQVISDRETENYRLFEQAGGRIYRPTEAQKQAFRLASQPLREWFIENYGEHWLNLLESSVKACEQ